MVAVRQAIDSAFRQVSDLVDDANHLQLEEVLLGPEEKTWRITVSYLVPVVENEIERVREQRSGLMITGSSTTSTYRPIVRLDPSKPQLLRKYKTIELDKDSGEFRQLLSREFE